MIDNKGENDDSIDVDKKSVRYVDIMLEAIMKYNVGALLTLRTQAELETLPSMTVFAG